MARQWLLPGYGQYDEAGVRQYLIPGYGQIQDNQAAAALRRWILRN